MEDWIYSHVESVEIITKQYRRTWHGNSNVFEKEGQPCYFSSGVGRCPIFSFCSRSRDLFIFIPRNEIMAKEGTIAFDSVSSSKIACQSASERAHRSSVVQEVKLKPRWMCL